MCCDRSRAVTAPRSKELDEINRPDDKLDYDEAVALLKQAQAVKQLLSGERERSEADRVVDVRSFVAGTLAMRDRIDQRRERL